MRSWMGGTGRIIPARAGFTRHPSSRRASHRDHPRSRGVYRSGGVSLLCCAGSSPLARGLPLRLADLDPPGRIIPARAGFTMAQMTMVVLMQDHPRSRGVYNYLIARNNEDHGSSPLARGLPSASFSHGLSLGIIPARAGFTSCGPTSADLARDHPRSRGVYPLRHPAMRRPRGSSPLARGLQGVGQGSAGRRRIIPARAGFTSRSPWRGRCTGDHPRSRGVYPRCPQRPAWRAGSSPLARGLREGSHLGR